MPFSGIAQNSLLKCCYASSAGCLTFSFVHLAGYVAPSQGLNSSESVRILKKIESITVIRFWENLTEDIKIYILFCSVDSYAWR